MAITKKLIKQGDHYTLTLDQTILDMGNIDPEKPLKLSSPDGESLLLSRVKNKDLLDHALEKIDTRYGDVMKRLAQ